MPDRLRRDSVSPHLFEPVHPAKNRSIANAGHVDPFINRASPMPVPHGSNVLSLSDQVGNNPMFLADLEVLPFEPHKFGSPEPTADQQRQDGPVALASNALCQGGFAATSWIARRSASCRSAPQGA
jgi:hypothetical protein